MCLVGLWVFAYANWPVLEQREKSPVGRLLDDKLPEKRFPLGPYINLSQGCRRYPKSAGSTTLESVEIRFLWAQSSITSH
jgi:hypothetical protein